MAEKKIVVMSFRCDEEYKQTIERVSCAKGVDLSEFIRAAIDAALEAERRMYESLHAVFGNDK